jgi:hypothetical protein
MNIRTHSNSANDGNEPQLGAGTTLGNASAGFSTRSALWNL